MLAEGITPVALFHAGERLKKPTFTCRRSSPICPGPRFDKAEELPKRYCSLASCFPKSVPAAGEAATVLSGLLEGAAQHDTLDCVVLSQAGTASQAAGLLAAMRAFYEVWTILTHAGSLSFTC